MKPVLLLSFVVIIFTSCKGLYYDIPNKETRGPFPPSVDYSFPNEGDIDISPGGAMLISFNKSLAQDSVNEVTVSVKDAYNAEVNASVTLEHDHIVVVDPEDNLLEESSYSLIISGDICDRDGLSLGEDMILSFRTGSGIDIEPPTVINAEPYRSDIVKSSLKEISVFFNEKINPVTIKDENFQIFLENKEPIETTLNYFPEESRVSITLDEDLLKNAQYFIKVMNVKDLAENDQLNPWESWFSTGAVQATETNIDCPLGDGWFGYTVNERGRILRLTDGSSIIDSSGLTWGDSLRELMDLKMEGPLDQGKCLRLIVNGKNVAAPDGMNLNPVLKKLYEADTPPPGQCYVDPVLGRFVLPRPVFRCRMDTLKEIYNPTIKPAGSETILTIEDNASPLYNNESGHILKLYNRTTSENLDIANFNGSRLKYSDLSLEKDTGLCINFSFRWNYEILNEVQSDNLEYTARVSFDFFGFRFVVKNGSSYFGNDRYSFNNTLFDSIIELSDGLMDVWLIREFNNNENKIKLIVDSEIIYYQTYELTTESIDFHNLVHIGSDIINKMDDPDIESVESELYIDDVQVWYLSDAVTQPWLYNNGEGRMDALHPIYGAEYDYRPQQVSAVYYHVP